VNLKGIWYIAVFVLETYDTMGVRISRISPIDTDFFWNECWVLDKKISVRDKKNYDTNWNTDDTDFTNLHGFFLNLRLKSNINSKKIRVNS
jgi:hypothetical protein